MPLRPMAKVEGDKALIAQLKAMGDYKAAKKILRKAVTKAGQAVVKEAKALVPRDTGFMRKNITKKVIGKEGHYTAIVGVSGKAAKPAPEDGGRQYIPSYVDHLVEYGFQHPNGTMVPAQSFIRKGLDNAADTAIAAMNDKIKDEIDKLAKGTTKRTK